MAGDDEEATTTSAPPVEAGHRCLDVTIDEHEVSHLGMLLEKEFDNTVRQMVTIVINQKGVAQGRLSRAEEYAFFCFMAEAFVQRSHDDLLSPDRSMTKRFTTPRWEWLLRGGVGGRRADQPSLFFPILIDKTTGAICRIGEALPPDEPPNKQGVTDNLSVAWPIRTDGSLGRWRVSPGTLRDFLSKGYVKTGGYDKRRDTWTILYLGKKTQRDIDAGIIKISGRDPNTNAVELEYAESEQRSIKTVWHRTAHDSGIYGSGLLRDILGESARFSYPKSLYAVSDALGAVVRDRPNALILDFFAGSGTTLHATCFLNAEDGGNRRTILVTNNEVNERLANQLNAKGFWPGDAEFEQHGICESVTWPRCKYVINGRRDDGTELPGAYVNERELSEPFEENLEYFKLDFLDPAEVAYGDRFEAIVPILWLMANAKGGLHSERGSRGAGRWFIPRESPYAVLLQEDFFAEFKREIKERPDIAHVFLVTDSEEAYREMIGELPGSPKTKMLYRSYLENFRINTERNL